MATGAAVKEERQTQIVRQMETQKGNLNTLEKVWSELYSRISSLLRDEPPQDDPDAKEVEQTLVSLADDIRHSNNRIQNIITEITRTIDRLEL